MRLAARTVLDEMILGQGLETAGASEALCHKIANRHSNFLLLGGCPAIAVLHQGREDGFLKWFLEIFVSL